MGLLLLTGSAVAVLFWMLFYAIRKMRRKRAHWLLHQLSECGSRHNLSFSSQELLQNRVLGLDGVHRKLVLLETDDRGMPHVRVIDLDEVAACYVTAQYGGIEPRRPERIGLQFHFKTARAALEIPFFMAGTEAVRHGQQVEQKARDWCVIINKMLPRWPKAEPMNSGR